MHEISKMTFYWKFVVIVGLLLGHYLQGVNEGSEKEDEVHGGGKNSITQKLLTIMAEFLDGEVSRTLMGNLSQYIGKSPYHTVLFSFFSFF